MLGRPALGYQNYEEVITENIFYIDKTHFIKEWWEYGDKVTLITRPRRFGKTLNMSTVECFFSNKYAGRGDLFEGKSIWSEKSPDGDYKYRQLQGTFPVVFLSFASVKTGDVAGIKTAVKKIISNVYREYRDMMTSEEFNDMDRAYFDKMIYDMSDDMAYTSINSLCIYLENHYCKKVIVLLDEYDTPMQEAWLAGNWDQAVEFFRSFFNATFKTNDHIYRGIITGITRISKESIFSDLNNLKVVTTTSDKYASCFGFLEEEVFAAIDEKGLGNEKQGVKRWYDGFIFGTHTDIYNPWSIISFIENNAKYDAYWSNTSGNGLVNALIQKGTPDIKQTMEKLLKGGSFVTKIDEQIVFSQLNDDAAAVWSLLLATGYLKVLGLKRIGNSDADEFDEEGDVWYTFAITNFEVKKMFRKMIIGWFGGRAKSAYNDFIKALLINDKKAMNRYMNRVALATFSYFDTGNKPSEYTEPERFYHGFVLGLMVELSDRYAMTSNRESGFGRYDVMLEPLNESDDAIIMEFKVYDPDDEKTLDDTVEAALSQIEQKHYSAVLEAKGIEPKRIRKYGFAFQGKECKIG
ncbi:MAG: ATP-binding protein [Lachnospiraceae bacterium]|nr:ATP-binding protein [Lachnospiraceae bacterium]